MIHFAFLIAFVYSANYCIEKTKGNCHKLCQDLPEDVVILNYFPDKYEVEYSRNNVFYFTEDVELNESVPEYIRPIYCAPNITFTKYANQIKLNSINLYQLQTEDAGGEIPYFEHYKIILKFNRNFTFHAFGLYGLPDYHIFIEATEDNIFMDQIYLDNVLSYENTINLSITENSKQINVFEISEKTKQIFTNYEKLTEIKKQYYCISDEKEKCSSYSSFNPTNIDSPSQISSEVAVLIINSNIPQILTIKNLSDITRYKIIVEEGSQLLINIFAFNKPSPGSSYYHDREFYLILHDDYIDMSNIWLEGKGKFTLVTRFRINYYCMTVINNVDLSIRSVYPERESFGGNIILFRSYSLTPVKKIKILEHFYIYGSKYYIDDFESERYYYGNTPIFEPGDDYYRVNYPKVNYYFKGGDHYLTNIWKTSSVFQSYGDDIVIFHFSNVHAYDDSYKSVSYSFIDDIIQFYYAFNCIEIRPSKLFEFGKNNDNDNLTVIVEDEIFMYYRENDNTNNDEHESNPCKFIGNGTIKINSNDAINKLKEFCTFDENINLEVYDESKIPNFNLCVGGSDINDCLNKTESDEINDETIEWIWMSTYFNYKEFHKHIKKIYIVDDFVIKDNIYNSTEIIVTKHAYIKLFTQEINISKNKINNFYFDNESSKITVFPVDYTYNITLNYESAPMFDFDIYACNDLKILFNNVVENYTPKSIKLSGYSYVLIYDDEEQYKDLFDPEKTILFARNNEIVDYGYEYYCLCDEENTCNRCRGKFRGKTIMSAEIDYNMSSKSLIRIFKKDVEISGEKFENYLGNKVYIEEGCHLNITDVTYISQYGYMTNDIGQLNVWNCENVIIKPKDELYFTLNRDPFETMPEMTIEVNNFLVIKHRSNENASYSQLNFIGNGLVSFLNDYPFEKIKNCDNVRFILGYYLFCGNPLWCNYLTGTFKLLDVITDLDFDFDEYCIFVIQPNTFDDPLDIDITKFNGQRVYINDYNYSVNGKLLSPSSKVKFVSTSVLTNKADKSNQLEGENGKGRVLLSNNQAENFIVAFNDKLIIKQEGEIDSSFNTIIVQPQSEKATIVFDENVKLDQKLIQITSEKEKTEVKVFVGDKEINGKELDKIVEIADEDKNKVEIDNGWSGGDNTDVDRPGNGDKGRDSTSGGGLGTAGIIGIVVGVVVVIAIVIVVVVIVIKRKKNNKSSRSEELSGA